MDRDLKFIWVIGLILGFATAITDMFLDFVFNPAQVFIGAAFLAVVFDNFLMAKKEKNPFAKRHDKFMGFLLLIMTLLLFVIAMLQNSILAFIGTFAIFMLVTLIAVVEMGMYSKLIPDVVQYEMLESYADVMRKAQVLGYNKMIKSK